MVKIPISRIHCTQFEAKLTKGTSADRKVRERVGPGMLHGMAALVCR